MNDRNFLDELIHYSITNLKNIEFCPNVDFNMPDGMYSEINNEINSSKIRNKDHNSEFYDENGDEIKLS